MSTKFTAPISDKEYETYRPIALIFRILGLFPVTLKRSRSKLLMSFSIPLMLYGFIVGGFAISMTYWGGITEITSKIEDALRVRADTDKLVLLIDLIVYSSVSACGIFLAPTDYQNFFKYFRFLKEVDYIIKTVYKTLEKYILLIAITIVVTINMGLGCLHISLTYKFLGDKFGLLGVLHRLMALDVLVLLVNVMECINQVLLNGLKKRIVRLNMLLKVQYDRMKNWQLMGVNKRVLVFTKSRSIYYDDDFNENHIVTDYQDGIGDDQTGDVTKLCKTYQIMMDAGHSLNEFLGFSTVAMVMAIFWALIESSYTFLLACIRARYELRGALQFSIGASSVIVYHIFRVLLITEPTHACLSETESTKKLVCKLLSCNVGRKYRKAVSRFAMVLELRKLTFSAKGYFNVDRTLFTSLVDTIVTLLMILIQYRADYNTI